MVNKKFRFVLLGVTFLICGAFTSCFSSGRARETLPQTAVTIQRVRVTDSFLGELLGAEDTERNVPMKIFIDNNEPLELVNGQSTTILVNNGEHMVYAVLGNIESRSVRFTARSQTVSINVSTNRNLLGRVSLDIEVR